VTNVSVANSDSIYIVFKAPSPTTKDYTLCQLRAYLAVDCSTRYNVTVAGHSMVPHCRDESDKMSYQNSMPDPPTVRSEQFWNVAALWANAMGINDRIANENNSNARVLTELITELPSHGEAVLSPLLPTIAEALSVQLCSMLMKSSINSTFYHYWNYTANSFDPGAYMAFNATLRTQQYVSGPSTRLARDVLSRTCSHVPGQRILFDLLRVTQETVFRPH
jgi:hypothetical protein